MNFHCIIVNGELQLYRGTTHIGYVTGTDDPVISLFNNPKSSTDITFGEFDIIQDNWNQLQEMQKKS